MRKTIGPCLAASSLASPSISASGRDLGELAGRLGRRARRCASRSRPRWPGPRPAQRQAVAERSGAADDRDRFAARHGAAVYSPGDAAYAAARDEARGKKGPGHRRRSGIGAATAARLAAEGAAVVIGDLNAEGAAAGRRRDRRRRGASSTSPSRTRQRSIAEPRPVLDPGQQRGHRRVRLLRRHRPRTWQRVIAVNLVGVFACTHAVLPGMQEAGYGRIVSIASEAGRVGSKGSAVYSAAKGGVIAFMKVIAREGARFGDHRELDRPRADRDPAADGGAASSARSGDKIVETMKAQHAAAAARHSRRRSPPRSPSWPPTTPPTSPARRSASPAAWGWSDGRGSPATARPRR